MSVVESLIASLAGEGGVRVVDLTTPLSAETPTLRLPDPFVNLIDFSLEEVSAYNAPGPFWKHHNIHTGEHIGTHVDAPVHWITGRDGRDVSQIPPERLVGPAVVIDKTAEVRANPDYLLTADDIRAWEAEHGAIASGSWLLVHTGWAQYGADRERFLNANESGPHSPGIEPATARWIAEKLPISGLGVETVGIDAGQAGGFDPAFPAHNALLGHDKYGLTSLRNLDLLPARGALVVVAPLPIVGGTGSPARVFALVDERAA
ncbi:MAG TPA: cyclase family protein [Microbacteriaceae bacterium]|nr:cyclase family protein [Microbacteriaceae bacterium]